MTSVQTSDFINFFSKCRCCTCQKNLSVGLSACYFKSRFKRAKLPKFMSLEVLLLVLKKFFDIQIQLVELYHIHQKKFNLKQL